MRRWIIILIALFVSPLARAEEIKFTVISTGDLHSRFESHADPFHLGGMARLKTAMDTIEADKKKSKIPVLRLDSGDCSEGSIYFNLGGGLASYDTLNHLDYHAIALGNHDWYLGPDLFNKVLTQMPPKFSYLASNLNWSSVPNHPLQHKIKPYEVFYLVNDEFVKKGQNGFQPKDGVDYFKVGVFGLATNESLFSLFFAPVKIVNPRSATRRTILRDLKRREKVDVIVALTHMLDEKDLDIAQKVSDISLIVGGHSHNKVIPRGGKPVVVRREDDEPENNTTWIVKHGEFGQFMGQTDLVWDADNEQMLWTKSRYQLHQVDSKYKEDSKIKARVAQYKSQLVTKYSRKFQSKNERSVDIFKDHIADTQIDLFKAPESESYFGNLIASTLLKRTKHLGTHGSVNSSKFLTHGLFKGPIHTAQIYNAFPHIYNPVKDRSWTIWTVDLSGAALKKAVDMVFIAGLFFDVDGMVIEYDPTVSVKKVKNILYQGKPIQDKAQYRIAISGGVKTAFDRLKKELPGGIVMTDTGIEIWGALRSYIKTHSPLRANDPAIRVNGRIRTLQPDLSIASENITVRPERADDLTKLTVRATIQNLGYGGHSKEELKLSKTFPTKVQFFYDSTPDNIIDDIVVFKPRKILFSPAFKSWAPSLDDRILPSNVVKIGEAKLPSLYKDQSVEVSMLWDVSRLQKGKFPHRLYVRIEKASGMGFMSKSAVVNGSPTMMPREYLKLLESNTHNNKAMAFVNLSKLTTRTP